MREREAQLELARKLRIGGGCTVEGGMPETIDNCDTVSICSSNEENVSTLTPVEQQQQQQEQQLHPTSANMNDSNKPNHSGKNTFSPLMTMKRIEGKPSSGSGRISTFERKKNEAKINISNKLEIFDNLPCIFNSNNHQEEDEPMGTLCKCAHIALTEMLPPTKVSNVIGEILLQERAESLSKSKSVLEFILWGPSDVALTGSTKERESALQRWLDLERATVLHGLVRTRIELTVYGECHLMFLVRSTAKIMNDAAKIVNND
ncbi:uncharacterized protein ACN427_000722 isoform 2-T5 [Glossina fuscipes fuscipes]